MNTILVIPARGGSKGIPRKNLRPMAGKPLIYYSINAAINAEKVDKVIVSTDDNEIALFAERFGATVAMRPDELSNDIATLDPVIQYVVDNEGKPQGGDWDVVVTVQPTSPLITSDEIDRGIEILINDDADTVMSVVDDRHLCWEVENDQAIPAYKERVNRQYLPKRFKETGAVVVCKREVLNKGSRIGEKVSLLEIDHDRSHDIDTVSDFYLCESLLTRKTIVFNVAGNSRIGLGHAFRTVMLANELVKHNIVFVVPKEHQLAATYIKSHNYKVIECDDNKHIDTILQQKPSIIINDVLDTDQELINRLKVSNAKIVNFEDLGDGINEADLVINALYPTKVPHKHVLSGADYFCLRDEFLHIPDINISKEINNILLCFGGVDEGDLTLRTINSIYPICKENNVTITAITGPGYLHKDNLINNIENLDSSIVDIVQSTPRISDYMVKADLAFTSGGRTVFELASVKVPTISICQNERELTHRFASSENGVVNLGHRDSVNDDLIRSTFLSIFSSVDIRELMIEKAIKVDLKKGKQRVITLIERLMDEA